VLLISSRQAFGDWLVAFRSAKGRPFAEATIHHAGFNQ
jgi:hypothetical protein